MSNTQRWTLKERIGNALATTVLATQLPYLYNHAVDILGSSNPHVPLADYAGNVVHVMIPYEIARRVEKTFHLGGLTNAILGLTTAYHVLGEVFHSQVAPNLPQILPGTPDIKDIPLTLAAGIALYLTNKKFTAFP